MRRGVIGHLQRLRIRQAGAGQGDGSTQLQQEVDQQLADYKKDMEALLASQADLVQKMEERKESRTSNATTGGTHVAGNVSFKSNQHIGDNIVGDKHVHGDQVCL